MPHPPHMIPPGYLETGEFSRSDEPSRVARQLLGPPERCWGSTSLYRAKNPSQVLLKNGNIATREHGKLRWGDLDLSMVVTELRELALALGVTVFALPEHAARFATAESPEFKEAWFVTDGTRDLHGPGRP